MCQPYSNPAGQITVPQKTSALNTDQLSRRSFLKASMSVAASPAMLGAAGNNVTTKVEARQSEPGLE
ncbi:twin-arginine translocation signal domain-containing protein [Ruegeria sp. HKCCA4008]|uniref:twin-arginine translocation signal domain-containing protein n=1 Tax=Ruegeria sp. HKCCA4008 TaxID=2682999 RepID=UPI0035304AF7